MSWTGTSAELLPGYRPGWAGLLRIGLWTALALWAVGALIPRVLPENIPFEKALAGSGVRPLATMPADSRSFREDAASVSHKFTIAWISDSGEALVPRGKIVDEVPEDGFRFLPALVAGRLREAFGFSDFSIGLYNQLGLHPANMLLYALQAIEDKPAAIVIELNPIWAFSPYQFYNLRDSLYLAPRLLAPRPALWPLLPLFVSPSQDTLALLGDRFPIIREAAPFKGYVQQRYAAGPAPARGAFLDAVPRTPVNYWILEQLIGKHNDTVSLEALSKNLVIEDYFLALVGASSTRSEDSFSLGAFEAMLRALKKSGILVLIYTAPLDDRFYADPAAAAKLGDITAYLSAKAASLAGTNITIIPAVPEAVRHTIGFIKGDGFHKWDPGALDMYLAQQVMRLVSPQPAAPPRESAKKHKR